MAYSLEQVKANLEAFEALQAERQAPAPQPSPRSDRPRDYHDPRPGTGYRHRSVRPTAETKAKISEAQRRRLADAIDLDNATPLLRARVARGMTQYEAARAIGINRATMSKLERGICLVTADTWRDVVRTFPEVAS